jgi:hypothetical protein
MSARIEQKHAVSRLLECKAIRSLRASVFDPSIASAVFGRRGSATLLRYHQKACVAGVYRGEKIMVLFWWVTWRFLSRRIQILSG